MRKILAALLAVLMFAGMLAVLPASAATEVETSSFDGTTSNTQIDLVITEMLINSATQTTLDNQQEEGSVSKFSSPDAFDYIEIYNRGSVPVNIYDYVILSANARDFSGNNKEKTAAENATNKYKFTMKNLIVPGDIHSTANGAASGSQVEYGACENPTGTNDGYINPGQFAIIWFWTSQTEQVCRFYTDTTKVGQMWDDDTRTFPFFRNFYGIDDSVKVFATNAKASNTTVDQFNDLKNGWIYALTKSTGVAAAETVDIGQSATKYSGSKYTLKSSIACMAEYSTNTAVGIGTTDNMDDQSAYYVPSNCSPDLYNANQKNVIDSENEMALKDAKAEAEAKGETFDEAAFKASDKWKTFTPATSYVSIEYAQSFKETAIVSFMEAPTPGGMPAWQWMYVDPVTVEAGDHDHGLPVLEATVYAEAQAAADAENPADSIFQARMKMLVTDWAKNTDIKDATTGRLLSETGTTTWQGKAMENFMAEYVAEIEEEEAKTETKKDYAANFVSRDVLEQRHEGNNKKKDTTKKGLPVWAIILIIVGGVVVVGGGVAAVVVVVVIKGKKKAATAEDDVASADPVQVIDETADETPADETPAEETKTEE